VLTLQVLILRIANNPVDEQAEYQIPERFSFWRFLGFGIEGTLRDANTVLEIREWLKELRLIDPCSGTSTTSSPPIMLVLLRLSCLEGSAAYPAKCLFVRQATMQRSLVTPILTDFFEERLNEETRARLSGDNQSWLP
jgi:hypothetical protein